MRRCTVNLQTCVGIGLAEKILAKIPSYDDMLAGKNDLMLVVIVIEIVYFSNLRYFCNRHCNHKFVYSSSFREAP